MGKKLSKGQREILEALLDDEVLYWSVFDKVYFIGNRNNVISKARVKTLADRGLIEEYFPDAMDYGISPAGRAMVASVPSEPEAALKPVGESVIPQLDRNRAVTIHADTAQNLNAALNQLLDMLAESGIDHAPVIERTQELLRQGILNAEPTPVDDDTALCPTCNGDTYLMDFETEQLCSGCGGSGKVSYAFLAGYWQAVATSAQRALTAANQRVERLDTQIAQLNSREHHRAIEALPNTVVIPIKSESDEMAASLLLAQSQLTTANERIAELEQNNRSLTDALESVSICLADWKNNTAVAWSHREVIEAIEIINEALD